MMTRGHSGALLILLAGLAWGQTADKPPAFDVADVHASAHVTNPYMRGGVLRGGRYDVRTASMVELIAAAYKVDNERVVGGPSWLETDRFDIAARAPVNTPPETVQLMLQNLLADRFKLKVHMDSKALPAFVLSLGKGKPKLKESDGSTASNCQGQPQNPQPGQPSYVVVACHNQTMEQLAQALGNMAGAYINMPVVDQTGLKGNWDFELKWTPRAQLPAAGSEGITIFDAVEKQLGLKLESQKVTKPVVVVDNVNERPTENPPGVTTSLPPPPPAEFEVATIRPSKPGDQNQRGRLDHGRLDAENLTLKLLIQVAWDLSGDELVVDAPKFVDTARYDITAKAPAAAGTDVDFEDLRLMLRALLMERWGLKAHLEERQVDGYVLSGNKPKMAKADPTNRTGCKEGPGPDGKDPRIANPIRSRLISCQNMTMAQFSDQLANLANGYVHLSVLDQTGLTDAYDFTLNFSPIGVIRNPMPNQTPASGANGDAADPSGALSLPEAVNKQLGLKLEQKKRPAQVLVIDHIEEKPTEN